MRGKYVQRTVEKVESVHVISIRRTSLLFGSRLISYDAFVFPYRMRLVSRFFRSLAPLSHWAALLFLALCLHQPLLLLPPIHSDYLPFLDTLQ